MALIDLVIPLYNREEFICGLIENLEKQTIKDFRVIFVDDGSTDNCYSVLQQALQKSTLNYLLLQQENQGPSAARNLGIEEAAAKWVAFMDSDDALLPEYLEYLYTCAEKETVQMAFCHLKMVPMGNPCEMPKASAPVSVYMSAAEAMQSHYRAWISPCCLLLDRKFLNDNHLRFDVQCRYCEDLMFITKCIAAAQTVCEVQNQLYIYYTHQGSLLRSSDEVKYFNGIEGFQRLENALESNTDEAVAVFHSMGRARFLIATFRKAALQMSWKAFRSFIKKAEYADWKQQIRHLPKKQKIAGYLYACSKRLFYYGMRILFED